jgi:hypothetical protein
VLAVLVVVEQRVEHLVPVHQELLIQAVAVAV